MPRFVVLQHDFRELHWDFMIEWGGVLRTWALALQPDAAVAIAAQALPDHRLRYLDYEGPISGNRGTVVRWDRGTYVLISQTDGLLTLRLQGMRCQGLAALTRRRAPGEWEFSMDAPKARRCGEGNASCGSADPLM